MNKNTMRTGFSLFELVVVMGLIAAVAGFSFALTSAALQRQEVDRVRETIRSELTAARADAIAGTGDASWGVAFSTNTVTRFQGSAFATRNMIWDRVTRFGNEVVISGASEIDFLRPQGIPSASSTIVLSDGFRSARITVTAAGAIEVY